MDLRVGVASADVTVVDVVLQLRAAGELDQLEVGVERSEGRAGKLADPVLRPAVLSDRTEGS